MKQKLNKCEEYQGRKRRGEFSEKSVMPLMSLCIEIVCASVILFIYFEVENLALDGCNVEGRRDLKTEGVAKLGNWQQKC